MNMFVCILPVFDLVYVCTVLLLLFLSRTNNDLDYYTSYEVICYVRYLTMIQ